MTKTLRNKKAFTLTELIVVIAVIGILAAVLIPSLTGYIKKAKNSAAEQEAAGVNQVYQTWLMGTEAGTSYDSATMAGTGAADYVTRINSFVLYYNSVSDTNATGVGTVVADDLKNNEVTENLTKVTIGNIKILSVSTNGFTMQASNNKKVQVVITNGSAAYTVSD